MNTKNHLMDILNSDLKEYTSIPFWSWNDELDIAELVRQIHSFKAQGIDGFIMHARTGLKTEYLGEEWFKCINACLSEAKKLGMQAWVYDENGWPSGFVEGRLLKSGNYAQYITYEVKDNFDSSASIVYSIVGERIMRLSTKDKADKYHCLYIKDHKNYADILDEKVVTQFINATHEEYYKRFKDNFGKELIGFFTDEPQYFRYNTPYTKVMPSEFKKAYGEDVFDGLIYLFIDTEKSKIFRYKYFTLMARLLTENFYKRIYDWCTEHNCKLTGHAIEETRIFTQIWCCGGVMPTYEYEHIPGVDWLARRVDCAISPKQVGSVAQQLGKKQVLTETFACSGWDATPRELRWIAEFQYVNGINSMCQHLVSYSLKGQGKSDHPPSFSEHNVWIKHSKPFNDYFKRLSYILCNTAELADTLFIHPIRSAYMTYQRESDSGNIDEIENAFKKLTENLSARGVQYHYGDESILKRHGAVDVGSIIVGRCRYNQVVVSKMESMESSTVKLLNSFAASGGKLCFTDEPPKRENAVLKDIGLMNNCDLDDIRHAFKLKTNGGKLFVSHRAGEIGEFLYIVNSSLTEEMTVEYDGDYKLLDLINVNLSVGTTQLIIPPMSSVILKIEQGAKPIKAPACIETDITKDFSFITADNNTLTLDFASFSKDGINWSKPYFVQYINEHLIKDSYCGKLWIKYEFTAKEMPQIALMRFEKNKDISVSLNGSALKFTQSTWDIQFLDCDLSGKIRLGLNEFIMKIDYFQKPHVKSTLYDPEVMESLKNCLAIDTEIESAYLMGQFHVNSQRQIVKLQEPAILSNLELQGFPNFAGKITFNGKFECDKVKNTSIKLVGRYMTASVKINDVAADELVLSDTLDISRFIKKGINEIELTLISSMRNMLGPHHFKYVPEPMDVGHGHFNFYGQWHDGNADSFTAEYNLVKFGLDNIILISYEE